MRRTILALSLLLNSGCASVLTPLLPPSTHGGTAAINQPVEPLGGLQFTPLTADNARYAGGAVSAGSGLAPMAASTGSVASAPLPPPMALASAAPNGVPVKDPGYGMRAPAPAADLSAASSGNMNGGFYGGYGPGFGATQQTSVVSLTQATAQGSRGPLASVMTGIVAPVLKDWAADAQLTQSSGQVGGDGLLTADGGWSLVYVSASRNEMLSFAVTAAKTTVVRERWAPLDLAAVPVGVDEDAAIKALAGAITTRGFQSEEAKTGVDYFLGVPYGPNGTNVALPGMPVPMIATTAVAPMPGPSLDPSIVTLPPLPADEVLYELPAGTVWNVSLQQMLGKPVWQCYANVPYMPQPMSQDGVGSNDSGANGLVDAVNGKVVRFSRPVRRYYATPVAYATPLATQVVPVSAVASPMPTFGPSASPSPQ